MDPVVMPAGRRIHRSGRRRGSRHHRLVGLAVAAGIVGGGCAGLGGGERSNRVHWPGDVDVPPDLIDCGEYTEPPPARVVSDVRTVRTIVRFVVTVEGEVAQPVVAEADRAARRAGLVDRALKAARGCRYEPARLDGRPVPVRWRHYFVFEIER